MRLKQVPRGAVRRLANCHTDWRAKQLAEISLKESGANALNVPCDSGGYPADVASRPVDQPAEGGGANRRHQVHHPWQSIGQLDFY